jgi:hypothetical protein
VIAVSIPVGENSKTASTFSVSGWGIVVTTIVVLALAIATVYLVRRQRRTD